MNPTTRERERNPATLPERRETHRGVLIVPSGVRVPRVIAVYIVLPFTLPVF